MDTKSLNEDIAKLLSSSPSSVHVKENMDGGDTKRHGF